MIIVITNRITKYKAQKHKHKNTVIKKEQNKTKITQKISDFFQATYKRGLCRHAVSVRLSVRHVRVLCRNEQRFSQTFFAIWGFSIPPLIGVSYAGGV